MVIIFTVLILTVILVNGCTDAPNAISTCVSTRAMSPSAALIMAALCNFAGSLGMALLNSRVAETVSEIVDFSDFPENTLPSLCAGMCAVIIWALIALRFGLPTSESHALLAGISGAAVAANMSFDAINIAEWSRVLAGLLISTLLSFVVARIIYSLMIFFLGGFDRKKVMNHFLRAQRYSAASSAFLHGAQDSQKFMGVFMLGFSLIDGDGMEKSFELPLFVIIICSATMTLGTLIGGTKIIKKVGLEMVNLNAAGGTASDMASSAVLSICSFFGLPVSTTHSKSCAMMGVGSAERGGGVDKRIVSEMLTAWLLTFPICALIGFFLAFIIC